NLGPGATVLVQGAGGGVSTALVQLGSAAGFRVWGTSRSPEKRAHALQLGADEGYEPNAPLPERADPVMGTVGAATWAHSIRSLESGGTLVVAGATTGDASSAGLAHIFFRQLSVVGATMGTRDELERLIRFCVSGGIRPHIHDVLPLRNARRG